MVARKAKTEAPVDRGTINELEKIFGPRRVLEKSEIQHHSQKLKDALSNASKKGTNEPGYPDAMVFLDDQCDLPLICVEVKKENQTDKATAEAVHYCSAMLDKGVYCQFLWAISRDESKLLWFNSKTKQAEEITIIVDDPNSPIIWNPTLNHQSIDERFHSRLREIFYSDAHKAQLDERPTGAFTQKEIEQFCSELNQRFHSDKNGGGGIPESERPTLLAAFLICCLNANSNGFPLHAANALKDPDAFKRNGWKQFDAMINTTISDKIPEISSNTFYLAGQENRVNCFLSILETIQNLRIGAESLDQVIQRLVNSFNLIGDAYEVFHTYTGGNDMGRYFTPRHLVDFVIRLIESKHMRGKRISKTDIVYDPACGVGGFLVHALRHALEGKCEPERSEILTQLGASGLYGNEFVASTADIARINMLLRGDGKTGIVRGSALNKHYIEKTETAANKAAKLNFNLSPIAQKFGCTWKFEDEKTSPIFCSGTIKPTLVLMNPPFPSKNSDYESYEFIEHALDVAADGAWIAAIVPESVLNGGKHFKEFRKKALERATLRAAIVLPPDIFEPRASVNTAVVILVKSSTGHDKTSQTIFSNASSDGREMHKGQKQRIIKEGVPDHLTMLLSHWLPKPNIPIPRHLIMCAPALNDEHDFLNGGEWSPFRYLEDDKSEYAPNELERLACRIMKECDAAAALMGLGEKW